MRDTQKNRLSVEPRRLITPRARGENPILPDRTPGTALSFVPLHASVCVADARPSEPCHAEAHARLIPVYAALAMASRTVLDSLDRQQLDGVPGGVLALPPEEAVNHTSSV